MLQLFRLPLYFSPDPISGSGTPANTGEMGKEDIIDFLAEDDEKEVIPIEDKPKSKTPTKEETKAPEKEEEIKEEEDEIIEEDDELKEIEEELEPPSEEQLELVTPVRRREILSKYPNLFKDFPYLEKAYYREQQFTELLPTIEDAKVAVEKAKVLDNFERDIMTGNTETVLRSVKETDPRAFNKIVDDYLPTLAKVDEKAYYHVLSNVSKHTIMAMVNEARRLGINEGEPGAQLQQAAFLLNQFVFGTSDFKPPTQLSSDKLEDKGREKEISERERKIVETQFENARNDLNTRVNNALKNTIEANIDPKASMSDYVRRNASRDAMDTLEQLITKDTRFRALVDKLWERAFSDGFTKESTDRIRSAYVSKAKTLLPSVIKKARNEALKGTGHRVREDNDSETTKRGPVPAGRPRSNANSGKITRAQDIPKGMSTIDFLNQD